MSDFLLTIGGKACQSVSKSTYGVINPATAQEIAQVPLGGSTDVERAVSAARAALPGWRYITAKERAHYLWRLATIVDAHRDKLARLETLDSGWPYRLVQQHHINRCIDLLHYFAGAIDKFGGRVVPIDPDYLSYTFLEPHGVVALLVPWNAPLSNTFLGLAPALACGNTVILKPSYLTPLATLLLGKLLHETGFPPGVVNIITGTGSEVGEALATHPGVDKITLTGGVETGRQVMRSASRNLKALTLELGGKTPVLVFPDADIEEAASRVASSAFLHQGQICTAASRVLLHRAIQDEFLDALLHRVDQLEIGDPFDPATDIGPMISREHRQIVISYIQEGKKHGGQVLREGTIPQEEGFYLTPTIFTGVDPDSAIAQEEIFGPVLSILTFQEEQEALSIANNVIYGLGASIWTKDLARAHYLAKRLENGLVWVNCLNLSHPAIPHGGHKQSGFGVENGMEAAIQSYSKSKTTWVALTR